MKAVTELHQRTAAELVELHNGRCRPEDRIDGPWKASKAELVGRIEALGGPEPKDEPDGAAEATTVVSGRTIGALVAELLADPDLGYAEIVAAVRERFPEARTTARSVASVAARMRRDGADVPRRGGKGGGDGA